MIVHFGDLFPPSILQLLRPSIFEYIELLKHDLFFEAVDASINDAHGIVFIPAAVDKTLHKVLLDTLEVLLNVVHLVLVGPEVQLIRLRHLLFHLDEIVIGLYPLFLHVLLYLVTDLFEELFGVFLVLAPEFSVGHELDDIAAGFVALFVN